MTEIVLTPAVTSSFVLCVHGLAFKTGLNKHVKLTFPYLGKQTQTRKYNATVLYYYFDAVTSISFCWCSPTVFVVCRIGRLVYTSKFNEVWSESSAFRVDYVKLNASCLSGSDQRPHLLSCPNIQCYISLPPQFAFNNTNPICSLVLRHWCWNSFIDGTSFVQVFPLLESQPVFLPPA